MMISLGLASHSTLLELNLIFQIAHSPIWAPLLPVVIV